jgi:glycosyltransferase involved in cell wall biosynthesis
MSVLTLAVPNRNCARFLESTLISLERNRPYVRWWLQDSCSTDNSVEIARRYAKECDRIEVEKDSGHANGLNRAISRMGGDIIGFLNSDDCLADGAAEAVLKAFQDNPKVELVYGGVEWIDADNRSHGFHSGDISSLADILDIYNVWWNRKQWVQPEVFWRRSLWERVGGMNEYYYLAFDYEYWVRCFQHGVVVKKIPQVLAKFRRHQAQKSVDSAGAAADIRNIVDYALDASPQIGWRKSLSLRNRLAYDYYQSGQNAANGKRDSFFRMLSSHPQWVAVPEVRARLLQSLKRPALNVKSVKNHG